MSINRVKVLDKKKSQYITPNAILCKLCLIPACKLCRFVDSIYSFMAWGVLGGGGGYKITFSLPSKLTDMYYKTHFVTEFPKTDLVNLASLKIRENSVFLPNE